LAAGENTGKKMKRPLVAVVSCYTIGLLLSGAFQLPLTALFAISFFVLVIALVLEKLRPVLIWLLLALAGWTNIASRIAVVSPDDLRTLIGNDAAIVTVQGTLTETPHLKIAGCDEQETEHSLAKVRVTEIRRDGIWQPACGSIIVSTPNPLSEIYFAGQPVEISGVIARPPPPLADGLFDYRDYLQTRGIYFQLKTESTNDWRLRPPILLQPPLTDCFLNWSKRTLALGLPVEDEPLCDALIGTIQPKVIVTADSEFPATRRASRALKDRLEQSKIPVIYTRSSSAVEIVTDKRGWKLQTMDR
jgi:hypothetical protein